jgi:hypothetical protein
MEIRQLDIKAAFLQSDLTEKIYLRMPPDRRVPGQEDRILELSRAIYGLKQASASFYGDVSAKLKSMGFSCSWASLQLKLCLCKRNQHRYAPC